MLNNIKFVIYNKVINLDIVIVVTTRTALDSFGGALSSIPAHKLGSNVISSLLQKTGLATLFIGGGMGVAMAVERV